MMMIFLMTDILFLYWEVTGIYRYLNVLNGDVPGVKVIGRFIEFRVRGSISDL
jgi:hypothetical protein